MGRMLSRREMLMRSATSSLLGGVAAGSTWGSGLLTDNQEYKTYFGDLHNHNSMGYAQGSLGRAFEIARNHLNFFACTPHGYWHDIGHYENNIENKWLKGFDVTRDMWPEFLALARKYDEPGTFVPMVGFEWHSTNLGDYHIIYPDLDGEYIRFDKLKELQSFAKKRGAILIPHHPANRAGHRGANMAFMDTDVSPVMEIYSEWGNAEHDRAPYPYSRHTEGGRWTGNTFQHFLADGYRLGVIASTDDHLGYPGAYREGLAAILAPELTREAIFDAIRHRRTYGVTGDRIQMDFRLNGSLMGQELAYVREREIKVAVAGWDQVDRVEIVKNNNVLHRDFPADRIPARGSWGNPVLLRFEYGWGPWPALSMTRTCDWDIHIAVEGGILEDIQPCFQSGPLDEDRRDMILLRTESAVHLRSFTALRQQFEDISTKGVVLKILGGPDTKVTVALKSPADVSLTQSLAQLAESGEMLFTGDFPKESAMLHRLVFCDHYETSYTVPDEDIGKNDNWYYLRVVQANNQLAWSSPIWVNARL